MAAKYSVFPICQRVMYCREVVPAISAVVATGLRRSTTKVVDLRNPVATTAEIAGTTSLQYITRWQMGNTLYFAAMQTTGGVPTFYAGRTQSVDLCSVSACFPHVLTYPE